VSGDQHPHGLVATGLWDESQVEVRWVDDPPLAPSWAEAVERDWAALRAQEPSLYDAPLAALRGYLDAGSRLGLVLARTSYRASLASHRHHERYLTEHGLAGLGMGIACSVGLVLADGALLLGRRSQRVMGGRGCWHPCAGHFDPDQHLDARGAPCPFAASRTEVHEEIGLEAHELADLRVIGIQLVPSLKPELHFTARVALGVDEVAARQARAKDAHEMDGLLALRAGQVDAFLGGGLGPFTEIAAGAVHLHRALGLIA
jgi:hypothetical protein